MSLSLVIRRRIVAVALPVAALTTSLAVTGTAAIGSTAPPIKTVATMDLSKPFDTLAMAFHRYARARHQRHAIGRRN